MFKEQKNEETFFQLLRFHNEIIDSIQIQEPIKKGNRIELKARKEIVGVNHLEVRILLSKIWELSPEIIRVITCYKIPKKVDKFKDLL